MIAFVLLLAFLLLMAVFRSIAIPIKAVIVNLLSVAAAYGVIVAVFQWGWLGSVFAIGTISPIDPWIPLMMFTILFGLSMDYEVFLLSAIRARYLVRGDTTDAVAHGIATTGGTITSAAAIMIALFLSFGFTHLIATREFGLGLAFELPVVVLALVKMGLLSYATLSRTRSYALIIILFLAAIIAPTPDLFTWVMMSAPLLILYESCIWIAWYIERQDRKRELAEAEVRAKEDHERLARARALPAPPPEPPPDSSG